MGKAEQVLLTVFLNKQIITLLKLEFSDKLSYNSINLSPFCDLLRNYDPNLNFLNTMILTALNGSFIGLEHCGK